MKIRYETELYHYGIKGQKWGIRRFQPYSYTGARKGGKLGKEIGTAAKKAGHAVASVASKAGKAVGSAAKAKAVQIKADMRAKKVEKLTANKTTFQKNYKKLTPEEREAAMRKFTDMQKIADMKADDIKRYANIAKSTYDVVHNLKGVGDDVSTLLTGKTIGENMKPDKPLKEGTKEWAEYQKIMADAEKSRAEAAKKRGDTEANQLEKVKDARAAELEKRKYAAEDAKAAQDAKDKAAQDRRDAFDKRKAQVSQAVDSATTWAKDRAKDAANSTIVSVGKDAAKSGMQAGKAAAKEAASGISSAVKNTRTASNASLIDAAANFDPDTYTFKDGRSNPKSYDKGGYKTTSSGPARAEKAQPWGVRETPKADKNTSSSLSEYVHNLKETNAKNEKVYNDLGSFTQYLFDKNDKDMGHSDDFSDELYHYGIPGMKWGIRKTPEYYSNRINTLQNQNARYSNKVTATKAQGSAIKARGMKLESRSLKRKMFESDKHYERRAGKQLVKGKRLQAKGMRLEARSAKYERKIYKNTVKIKKYNNAIEEMLREVPA